MLSKVTNFSIGCYGNSTHRHESQPEDAREPATERSLEGWVASKAGRGGRGGANAHDTKEEMTMDLNPEATAYARSLEHVVNSEM